VLKAKFVPDEMRVQLVDELLKRMSIRELADAVGVDPRAVTKYRARQAYPTDEVFSRIFSLTRTKFEDLYQAFITALESEFSTSEVPPIEPARRLEVLERPKVIKRGPEVFVRPEVTGPEVRAEPQKILPPAVLSRLEMISKLSPADIVERKSFGGLISAVIALRKFTLEQLTEYFGGGGYPRPIVEKFLGRMVEQGFLTREGEAYELKVQITG